MQYPLQDSKRVLECLQKALRIANSATEEIITIQLYCDTLDQYCFYLDRGAPAVSMFILSFTHPRCSCLPRRSTRSS